MKKWFSIMLAALMLLSLCAPALAAEEAPAAPAAGSLAMEREVVRGNAAYTLASYPEIWITPYFDEHIIVGNENYPANFLRIAPPEGATPMEFTYDQSVLINHDDLSMFYYIAYDRVSYELFLEKAEEENTLSDGSDGAAIYTVPDSNRAYALIDISDNFGDTSKLEIIFTDYTRELNAEALGEAITAEVARVRGTMEFVELDHYWSQDVFSSVQLHAESDPISVLVDTTGLIVTKVDGKQLIAKEAVSERMTSKTEIIVEGYSYVESKEGETTEVTLDDGTVWTIYNSEYTGYASTTLLENGNYDRPLYLTIKIDAEPDAFQALFEAAYARVTVTEEAE